MLNLKQIVKQSDKRFSNEIEQAKSAKKTDSARIERRKNEVFFTRLVRACLQMPQNKPIDDRAYSLCTAIPELVFSKMYVLGWGAGRKLNQDDSPFPPLLYDYFHNFIDATKIFPNQATELFEGLNKLDLEHTLLCHGLSPTSDTLLLLCDIGRTTRISYSLGINDIEVLLADVSWIKHNRSIKQRYSHNEFVDQLRVCLDRRKRLYRALKLKYTVFGISDYNSSENYINKSELLEHTVGFRDLAELLWGHDSLAPQNAETKKVIGTNFNSLNNKDLEKLPKIISKLIAYKQRQPDSVANALETSLKNELNIFRPISELFSSFDEDIFIYYFAQYFAQQHYNNFLKIAPLSEEKFDQPFIKYRNTFDSVTKYNKENNKNGKKGKKEKSDFTAYIYCPQYQIGSYELLPYSSISGDVLKQNLSTEEFFANTILIDDYFNKGIDKIVGVILQTPIFARNRLLSDLFSFTHFLVNRTKSNELINLKSSLATISESVADQIFSLYDVPESYSQIFSDWIKAVGNESAVVPFHIEPFLWEEEDWSIDKIKNVSSFIYNLLGAVNIICE